MKYRITSNRLLAEKDKEADLDRHTIMDLNLILTQKDKLIDGLKDTIARLLNSSQPELDKKDKEIERLKQNYADAVEGMSGSVRKRDDRISELEQENATLQKQASASLRMVIHQDKKIHELEEEQAVLRRKVAAKDGIARIEELEKEQERLLKFIQENIPIIG